MERIQSEENVSCFGVDLFIYAQDGGVDVVGCGLADGRAFDGNAGDEDVSVDFETEVWRECEEWRGVGFRHCGVQWSCSTAWDWIGLLISSMMSGTSRLQTQMSKNEIRFVLVEP